jgi:hypothetical protein
VGVEQGTGEPTEASSGTGSSAPPNQNITGDELGEPGKACPSCGAANATTDRFCTTCGALMLGSPPAGTASDDGSPGDAEATLVTAALSASDVGAVGSAKPAVRAGDRPIDGRRRRWPIRAISLLAVVATGTAVALGVLWHNETRHAHDLQASLDRTRATLTSTEAALTATRAQLSSITSLANKRRAVLLQAQNVLLKVDPLLSSVDGLQSKAGTVQVDGNGLTDDAETLIQTIITIANYLINTNTAYVDSAYVGGLIENANAELGTLRADELIFSGAQTDYGTASTEFGNRADGFSRAVLGLQKQLKKVTGP